MKIYTGKYKGNGVANRVIATPLDPVLVIVKRAGASAALWKTDTMPGNRSSYFGGTTDTTNGIKTLTTGGFTVGTGNEVNALNEEYDFIAFEGEDGDIETGTYIGTGNDNDNHSWANSHSAAPKLMLVKEQDSTDATIWRDESNSSDSSNIMSSTPSLNQTNLIQSLSSSAFQVGSDTKINASGVSYHWVALFADTGAWTTSTYTGDGTDAREQTNIGLQTDFLLVFNKTTATDPVMRFKDQSGDNTYPLIAASGASTNKIEALYRDDFVLGSNGAVNTNGETYRYFAFKKTAWAFQDKYHISLDGLGYIVQHNSNGRPLYEKKPTQDFVSKFGSGDASYRDSSFWQFWAQVNWRNGAKQLRFDDAGKFWKSENIDVTQLEAFKLSKQMVSAGQIRAGTKVLAMSAFRTSQNWWDSNYGYRQRLTITAPASDALPVGYPVLVTVDSAALQTASKVRSDRKDWRIVYWNGSSWVDLSRDYVTTTKTVFALQAEIAAGSSDNNYYLHYGYASESTDKQPSTDADWNAVYGMYGGGNGVSVDSNTIAIWHMKEGSGTTAADTDSTNDASWSDTRSWGTDGPFGRALSAGNGNESQRAGVTSNSGGEMDTGSMTWEFWAKSSQNFVSGQYGIDNQGDNPKWKLLDDGNKLYFEKRTGSNVSQQVTSSSGYLLSDSAWHHYAITFDGSSTAVLWRDGVQFQSMTFSGTAGIRSASGRLQLPGGAASTNFYFAHVRLSNSVRTSFPYAKPGSITATPDTEQTTTPPESSFSLFAGLSDGSIHKWDGNVSWTEQFDTRRITWLDSGDDADSNIGNVSSTEEKRAQSFQIAANAKVKGVSVYIKKGTLAQNITVRIETNNAGVPSGTLVDSNATATIALADIPTSAGWVTVEFPAAFSLTGSTVYYLILQSANFGSETGAMQWRVDGSSPTYSSGSLFTKSGAGAWTADTAKDAMFRILGNTTSVNCALLSKVGGTQKIFWGTGLPSGEDNGDARLYSYDGSTWRLEKIFNSATEASILSLTEYIIGTTAHLIIGTAPQAKVYKTSDVSTFTLSKDIDKPQNPGYPYALFEYNKLLFAGGGSPEFLDDKMYNGFFYAFDQADWNSVLPFDFTVIKSMQFYDAFLFLGSYHGQVFVFNTVTLDPLFSFFDDYNYQVQVWSLYFFDDKLWIGLTPQNSVTAANEGLWMFDRHGMSQYAKISGVEGYYSMAQVNNELFVGTGDDGNVYRLSSSSYASSGFLQSSYFDALLPSINKLFNSMIVQFDPLPAGTSITVYYKFKESDSWTQLGDAITTSGATDATLNFATGTIGKKISFKFLLATNDSSQTPVVREYVLKYSVYPQRKWQWTLRLLAKDFAKLLDNSRDVRTGNQIRADIEAAQQAQALNTFKDIDGKEYTVLFHNLDLDSWVVNQEDNNEGSIAVTFLEA